MKIKMKCTDANKLATVINVSFALYRARPQYNVIVTRETNDSFRMRGTEENKKKWLDLFIDCVVDYAVSHGILITGRVVRDQIIFEDLKSEQKAEEAKDDNTTRS